MRRTGALSSHSSFLTLRAYPAGLLAIICLRVIGRNRNLHGINRVESYPHAFPVPRVSSVSRPPDTDAERRPEQFSKSATPRRDMRSGATPRHLTAQAWRRQSRGGCPRPDRKYQISYTVRWVTAFETRPGPSSKWAMPPFEAQEDPHVG